jgi:hypothetical protein
MIYASLETVSIVYKRFDTSNLKHNIATVLTAIDFNVSVFVLLYSEHLIDGLLANFPKSCLKYQDLSTTLFQD